MESETETYVTPTRSDDTPDLQVGHRSESPSLPPNHGKTLSSKDPDKESV